MPRPVGEMAGVRLGDVYRDHGGRLWEVISLCDKPTATVRRADGDPEDHLNTESHVIGCLNWTSKWKHGPLREVKP